MENWVQLRIRSKWAETMLPIIILDAISKREPDEWELINMVHDTLGSTWNQEDARKILDALIRDHFVHLEADSMKLRVGKEGSQLLSRLHKEYAEIVSLL